jgi:uncharacterized protein YfbU (UPF0304 family)
MELKPIQRLMLINQYKILEALYEEDRDYYSSCREILEEGYELHYQDLFLTISDDVIKEDECKEVLDILDLYRAITFSYRKLEDKEGLSEYMIKFEGFDANDEEEYRRYLYTRYFILKLDRYKELQYNGKDTEYNSHSPKLPKYRRMLEQWKKAGSKQDLTKEEIFRILDA